MGREQHGNTIRRKQSPEYVAWSGIKKRCLCKNTNGWHNYGGRGIGICDEFKSSFSAFLAEVGPRPSPDYSIERIDNDNGYVKGNIRWAVRKEQARNKRTNHVLTIDGESRSVAEWSEISGINYRTILSRLVSGIDAKLAVFSPSTGLQIKPGERNRMVTALGQTKMLSQWSRDTGHPLKRLSERLDAGWPPDSAMLEPKQQGKRKFVAPPKR